MVRATTPGTYTVGHSDRITMRHKTPITILRYGQRTDLPKPEDVVEAFAANNDKAFILIDKAGTIYTLSDPTDIADWHNKVAIQERISYVNMKRPGE